MEILIEQLSVKNFKGHKELKVDFKEVTKVSGRNGEGKSSIGEAITWNLYGTDTMGSSLDPTPLYECDGEIYSTILLKADDKEVLLTRGIENGKNTFYINEVPKKSGEFKELVDSLFSKELFLSIFNPSFFPSQHWKEQRNQLLQYVSEPLKKEIFEAMADIRSKELEEPLKKYSLEELEKMHRDRFRKRDKEIERASERVLTLKEQLEKSGLDDGMDLEDIHARWLKVDEEIKSAQKVNEGIQIAEKKLMELDVKERYIKEQIMKKKKLVEDMQEQPSQTHCSECRQELDPSAKAEIEDKALRRLSVAKQEGKEMVQELADIKKAKEEIDLGELTDTAELIEEANRYRHILMDSKRLKELYAEIKEAEKQKEQIRNERNQSLSIIEAIKEFNEKKANLMVDKVNNLFGTLRVKLFEEQKNGELKQTFELEMNGTPYTKLSTAEKVKAGIELIYVIQKQAEVEGPTFIDNAESLLNMKYAPGQTIVSTVKNHKLKIEGAN